MRCGQHVMEGNTAQSKGVIFCCGKVGKIIMPVQNEIEPRLLTHELGNGCENFVEIFQKLYLLPILPQIQPIFVFI